MAGIDDVVTKLDVSNRLMGQLVNVVQGLFPRSVGSFTMAAAATKTVTDGNVTTTSFISLTPTNASAAALMAGANSLYVTAGTGSFVVSTAGGGSAAGTETLAYAVFNAL